MGTASVKSDGSSFASRPRRVNEKTARIQRRAARDQPLWNCWQNDARIRSALGARRPLCRGPGAGGDHRGTWIAAGLLPLQRGKRRRTEAVPQSGGGITARRTECRLRTLNQPQHPAVRREITVRLGPTQRGKRRQANRQTGDNGCQPDRCNGDNGSRPAVATADNGGRDCAATKDRRQSGLPTTHVVGVL